MQIVTVRPGESVYSIARRFGVPTERIIADNQLSDPARLVIGQALVVNTDNLRYTVKAGDTLYKIGQLYGVSVQDLQNANPGVQANNLQVGQVITIPPAQKLGSILVNGYAFPNITDETLAQTLPYLSYLSIFSYEVTAEGGLKSIDDTRLIEGARAQNVAPMMVITNLEEGGFSSQLASTILNSEVLSNRLLDNVETVLNEKNYYGLDVDFEYIYPSDREAYNRFLQKAADRLRPQGYSLTTAVAPKISEDQAGTLYEGHDYRFHGQVADHVIIMTYEWGYTNGPPLAVAPYPSVRRVLDYAVTAIPTEKILMGMPNYGYDWKIPWQQGTAASSISNLAAVDRARDNWAMIVFDQQARAPYFNYYAGGQGHEVWFDDARSLDARLRLVAQYGLGGVSYWTVNRFFRPNWLVLSSLYSIQKVL